jgi:hypothetical protein
VRGGPIRFDCKQERVQYSIAVATVAKSRAKELGVYLFNATEFMENHCIPQHIKYNCQKNPHSMDPDQLFRNKTTLIAEIMHYL